MSAEDVAPTVLPTLAPDIALASVAASFHCEAFSHATWVVRHVTLDEELSGDHVAVVAFQNYDLDSGDERDLVGTSADVTFSRPDGGAESFKGVVVSVVSEGVTADRQRRCTVKMVPAFQALSRQDWARWVDKTVPEILNEVLHAALDPQARQFELRLTRQNNEKDRFPVREYTAQRGESAYQFVRRLCSEEGLTYCYEHTERFEKLVICDSNSQLPNPDRVIHLVHPGAGSQSTESVSSFRLTTNKVPDAVLVDRFDPTRPELALVETAKPEEQKSAAANFPETIYDPTGVTLHDYQGDHYNASDAKTQARLRLEARRAAATLGRGQSNALYFRAGTIIELSNPFGVTSTTDGRYLLTTVQHHIEIPVVGSTARPTEYSNDFACIPSLTPFRMQRLARPAAGHDYAVVVAAAKDDPIHHDAHGRVMVKFYWDRTNAADGEKTSCWLPVLSPWAGGGRGLQAIPRKGDVVLVGYEHGDPDRPFVAGSINTGTNRLSFGVDEKTNVAWRTQSQRPDGEGGFFSPHFNEIRMDDAANAELLALYAGHDFRKTVLHDAEVQIRHDSRETVGREQTIAVTSKRTTTVGTKGKDGKPAGEDHTTIIGTRTLDVSTHDLITVGEEQQTIVAGDRTAIVGKHDKPAREVVHVHGSAELEVEHSSSVYVKEQQKTKVDGELRFEQSATVISCTKGQISMHGESWIRIERGSVSILLDEKNNLTITTDKDVKVQATEISLGAEKIAIEAQQEAKLAVGPSEIKLTPQGVSICGPNVSQKADSMHQTTAPMICHN